mgnify:CR=1 FL=1
MKKVLQLSIVSFMIFLIISTATLIPATSTINTDRFDAQKTIKSFMDKKEQGSEHNLISLLNQFSHRIPLLNSNIIEKLSNNNQRLNMPNLHKNLFSNLNTNLNLTTAAVIILFVFIFAWAFTIGGIAVAFPEILPVLVRYVEIVASGVVVGAVTDGSLFLYRTQINRVNQFLDRIIQDENLSELVQNLATTFANITNLPGVTGGISAFFGVVTALNFMQFWDAYKILQFIGGGLFVAVPIIIPVALIIFLLDFLFTLSMNQSVV